MDEVVRAFLENEQKPQLVRRLRSYQTDAVTSLDRPDVPFANTTPAPKELSALNQAEGGGVEKVHTLW